MNLFQSNQKNMAKVAKMFRRVGFGVPSPRNFGRLVKSFNLELAVSIQKVFSWRLAFNKFASFIL